MSGDYTEEEQLRDRFLHQSNQIEGVYDHESFEQALRGWGYLIQQDVLTLAVVLETHRILMLRTELQPDDIGHFRRCNVRIGGRLGLQHEYVPYAMEEWLEDVATSLKVPGINGGNFKVDHVTYEKIHPFVDGNGRTGRMFWNWARVKAGFPILVIEASNRHDYYKLFH